jgi:hypothetical protein
VNPVIFINIYFMLLSRIITFLILFKSII